MAGPERTGGAPDTAEGGQPLSFTASGQLHRSGHGHLLTDDERERIGAGASWLMIITLFCGLFGLGPVGLVTGYLAMQGQRTSSWVGVLGIVLSAAHTLALSLAFVLALATEPW